MNFNGILWFFFLLCLQILGGDLRWRLELMIRTVLDKGRYVFMDNYYTSVALFQFEEMEERKTLACGTVRSNRVGLPKEICDLKEKEVKGLK